VVKRSPPFFVGYDRGPLITRDTEPFERSEEIPVQAAVVRLSRGTFEPQIAQQVRARLEEGRASLEPALRTLQGLLHYYVAVDEQGATMINVSVWTGLVEARQMDVLAPMLAQRLIFEQLGVRFDPIRNYPTLWAITP